MTVGAAEYLLNDELLKSLFEQMEQDYLERAVNAKAEDDEMRRICTMQVRAIRQVRTDLEALLSDQDTLTPRPVV